jgi:hypothetical protein
MIETEYQRALLKRLSAEVRNVAFFGRVTGKFELDKGGWVHPSVPGQCDVYGVRKRDARHFEKKKETKKKKKTKTQDLRIKRTKLHNQGENA